MGLSAFYASASTTTEEQACAVIKHAYDKGVTLFNTASFYGPLNVEGYGHNLRLLRKAFSQPGIDRSKIQIMCKVGMDTRAPMDKTGSQWIQRCDKDGLVEDVDFALKELGVEYIDIIVLCRAPKDVSIETSVGAMAEIVASGKARHIGLSECSSGYIRRGHAVASIYCIEQEWSLWSRDIEEDIVGTCRELGTKIVAYSPLGRGFLTGTLRSRTSEGFGDGKDWRLVGQPKFAEGALESNLELLAAAEKIAARLNISMGKLSLAWLHAQGEDVIPIPGTTKINHLDDNLDALKIKLSPEDVQELNAIFKPEKVVGDRYPHKHI